jgi:hypothetical protein
MKLIERFRIRRHRPAPKLQAPHSQGERRVHRSIARDEPHPERKEQAWFGNE